MFHNAKWITASQYPYLLPANANTIVRSAYVRKEFPLEPGFVCAQLTVCALGLGVVYLNGQPVTDDVLTTPFTAYDRRIIYNTYHVTQLLRSGSNCIAVHLGNGFYNNNMHTWNDLMAPWRDVPKVQLSLRVLYPDQREVYMDSDRTFRGCLGPVLFNHMRQGEVYDARLEQPGFSEAGFCDDHWEPVKRIHPPGGLPEPADQPPIRVTAEYAPVCCRHGIYDFGVNISGWVKIRVRGEAGTRIILTYDERLNDDGTALYSAWKFAQLPELKKRAWRGSNAFSLIEGLPDHRDEYILKGGEEEIWSPSFCYHGFRYVKAENAPEDFSITAQFVHTDFQKLGTFTSDCELLNRLHEMSVRSLLSNNVGIPTDCPHREQNGWPGDALLASRQAFFNYDMYDFYRSWLRNYKTVQRPDGQLPALLPTAGWGFNWGPSTSIDTIIIRLPYYGWLATGRTEMIEDLWENMVRYFAYMDAIAEDGIIEYGLPADWSCSNLIHPCPIGARDTADICHSLHIMAKLACITGRNPQYWQDRAEYYKAAWRREFWSKQELRCSQTFLAIALHSDILEETEIPDAAAMLAGHIAEQDFHFNCGIDGVSRMFSVLSETGYIEHLYKAALNPTYPSYAFWVQSGLTTLPEDWDMSQSQNHQLFSEIDHWLYRYVGGIRYTDAGLLIAPIPLKEVGYVKVTHNGICVERNGSSVTVTLPCNARIQIGNTDTIAEPGTHSYSFL